MLNILLILSTSTIVMAGITTTKVAPKIEIAKDNTPYDGKKNFLGDDAHKYIGQTLYLKAKREMFRKYGYRNFYSNYKDKITYKSMYSYGNYSKYEKLAEKEYKVLDVIKGVEADYDSNFIKSIYGTLYILKIKNKTNNDIIYYKYGADTEASFPFIVMKFYEKQKNNFIGKEFIISDKNFLNDYITGKPITIIPQQKWKCLDFTIDNKGYNFSLILQNELGEHALVSYRFILGRLKKGSAYTLKEAEDYNNKFGKTNFNAILKRNIIIGMTEEEVLLSWNKPKSINKDIFKGHTREQWIYDSQYIYFENGKLTAIQNR